jgi:hypothetical protein
MKLEIPERFVFKPTLSIAMVQQFDNERGKRGLLIANVREHGKRMLF